jgi:hypothetical protein
MPYLGYFSTFISRTRLSQQYVAAPASIPPAEAGTPGYCISGLFSTFISRIRRSRQDAAAPAGVHRLKPGRQGIASPNYFSTFISRITGSGIPGRMPLPRQASHRLKPGFP